MISDDEAGHQVSYWPSISDLFMTLFITAIALVGVVLFVFLVNPAEPAFKAQIIELRGLLGMPPLPPEENEKYQGELGETIRRAIAAINACKQLEADVDALATCLAENRRLADENREVATLREHRAALLSLLMALMEKLPTDTGDRGKSPDTLAQEVAAFRAQLATSEQQRKALEAQIAQLNDKPPIITVASDVLFTSGGFTVTAEAITSLQKDDLEQTPGPVQQKTGAFEQIAAEILARNANGSRMVDTLEIIGHTDSLPMKAAHGNLDAGLPAVLAGTAAIGGLKPGSNIDLGLLRALAIKQAWQAFVAGHPDRPALEGINVRTYSAGQTIPFAPNGPKDDARSRRIELRLTKLGAVGTPERAEIAPTPPPDD